MPSPSRSSSAMIGLTMGIAASPGSVTKRGRRFVWVRQISVSSLMRPAPNLIWVGNAKLRCGMAMDLLAVRVRELLQLGAFKPALDLPIRDAAVVLELLPP